MRYYTLILSLTLFALRSFSQVESGWYKGFERMCSTNNKGKVECYDPPRIWYHINSLYVDKDSVFLYKEPIRIEKQDTFYSASDGGFYYYLGTINQTDSGLTVNLEKNNCDYCGVEIITDSATGFMFPVIRKDTFKVIKTSSGIKFNNVEYLKTTGTTINPEFKKLFYFDSNSIYRVNPKGQYKLISTGIKYFLRTKDIKLDNDTLRICVEHFEDNVFDRKKNLLLERINPDSLTIDTTGIIFKYYTLNEIKALTKKLNRPIRYVEIGEIIDYMKAGRITLTYKISLPPNIHNFSERQYGNLFEFNKVGKEYILAELPENGWELIERK